MPNFQTSNYNTQDCGIDERQTWINRTDQKMQRLDSWKYAQCNF